MKRFNFEVLNEAASMVLTGDYAGIVPFLRENTTYDIARENIRSSWEWNVSKFDRFIGSLLNNPVPEWKVFTVGNSKLPFLSFSALPGKGHCPGAGSCLDWCYSFKGWRNAGVFFRQMQNSILLRENFQTVEQELNKILNTNRFKVQDTVDFRLYVDGDFHSVEVLTSWMQVLWSTPKLRCYGYSKSLGMFEELANCGFQFPSNYALNLSTGGKFDNIHDRMQAHDFVRGAFDALDVHVVDSEGKRVKSNGFSRSNDEKRALYREAKRRGLGKTFVCPGQCGDCVKVKGKNVHACGDFAIFDGYRIVIPVH